MTTSPNNPTSFGERLKRLPAILTIAALGTGALGACKAEEVQAQRPPVSTSVEATPSATPSASETPAPTETESSAETLVGVVDVKGLDPAAVEFAKTVTPDILYGMSQAERIDALTVTPDMYDGNTEKLADLQFAQFASIIGLANHVPFVTDARNNQGWINLDYYTGIGNELLDGVYGAPVSAVSESASARFTKTAMRTEGVIGDKEIATSSEGKSVGDYKVIVRKTPNSTQVIVGDVVSSSADLKVGVVFDAPLDYTALVNDPNIMDPNSPVVGNGEPETEKGILVFSDVKERDGKVVTTGIVIGQ